MFNNKDLVRKYIFALFGFLILGLSLTLTYYISFYEESLLEKGVSLVVDEENKVCNGGSANYFIYSLWFKLFAAFIAGGVLSDGLYIKMGVA